MVVGSVVSIVVSIMLFLGAKQGKSLFFIPWLTEQIIALSAGIIHGLIMAMGGFLMEIKAFEIVLVMVIFVISSFMIYSVLSHFFILSFIFQATMGLSFPFVPFILSREWSSVVTAFLHQCCKEIQMCRL